jgi:hypothetical protein
MTAAPIRTGRDGGMHPSFLAKLKPQEIREVDGTVRYVVDESAKKKLGSYVNPPLETFPAESDTTGTAVASGPKPKAGTSTYVVAAAESKPAPAPARASDSGGVLSGLWQSAGRWLGGEDNKPVSPPAAKAAAPVPTPKPAARPHPVAHAKPQPAAQPAQNEPEQTAQITPAPTPARQSAASGASLMSGAAPTVPTGSFDQRWGAIR